MKLLRLNLKVLALVAIAVLTSTSCTSLKTARPAPAEPGQETPAQREARLQWWRAARFGMFIHWGPVSLKGTEIGWSRGAQVPTEEYDRLYLTFNPTNFNADTWAKVAKAAGMKYMVLTSKHHDGFCLWDTKYTDYNIMHSPFARDVVKELAAACRRQGIVFCVYHSICDWYHPDYPLGSPGGKTPKPAADMDRYNEYLKNQLRELLTRYGRMGILWFDGDWEKPWNHERGLDLYKHVRSLQPAIIINNRVGIGRSGMAGTTARDQFGADYDTPEQRIGKFQYDRPWETCMTICHQWAWKPDDQMKSLQQCLHTLIQCAGGDGNLLFNVGPMPAGEIEPRQVQRLQEMGAWLKKYGESIYGTRGGPYKPSRQLASTRQGKYVYLHILNWDGDSITLPKLPRKIRKVKVLTGGVAVLKEDANNVNFWVPQVFHRENDTILKLELDGSAMDIAPIATQSPSLSSSKKAAASNVYQISRNYSAAMAVDDDDQTRWATDQGTKQAWLQVDLGQPAAVSRTRIAEAFAGRVQKFELQYQQGGEWKTLFAGTTLGENFSRQFEPVTAQHFRLNILEATEGPTINEFQLFGPGK